jgi:molybdate transport system substrate-binding protein
MRRDGAQMCKTTVCIALVAAALVAPLPAARAASSVAIFPPWQHGQNNDATDRGLAFTVPDVDDLADFHGDLTDPKLVLYVGGNYFFAMAPLVAAFEQQHPDLKGRIYWETLPPGLLVKQIKVGGTVTSGNLTWTAKADAYFAGLKAVGGLIERGALVGPAVPYVTNTLTIMVPAGNPGRVSGLADLGRPDLRLAMPNPAFEGIARQIEVSLKKAGGAALSTAVYKTKVADGRAILTRIHHRQTPLFLMQGRAQAGVTWQSEAIFQEQVGNPIAHVDIPAAQNTTAIYAGAVVNGAPHANAARLWLSFVRSPAALAILERYGFKPYASSASAH